MYVSSTVDVLRNMPVVVRSFPSHSTGFLRVAFLCRPSEPVYCFLRDS